MANDATVHVKLLIGEYHADLIGRLAQAHAEIERLREEVVDLRAKLPRPPDPPTP